MKIRIIVIVFALCVVAVIIGHYALTPPSAHVVVAVDLSLSVKRNCAGLRNAAESVVSHKEIQEGSTLTLLAMGNSAGNPEPLRLFDKPAPIPSDAVFGRDDAAFEQERQDFFVGLQKACEATPNSRNSPILRLVSRGIAHLRSRGCARGGRCFFTLQTDLEDDQEPRLAAIIQRAAKNPAIELPAELAGSIDNAGIQIVFCGTSEIRPRRNAKLRHAAPETLARIWKGLFINPDLVSFQPYCGQ